MAIGKGSMARAAKVAKDVPQADAVKEQIVVDVKPEVKVEDKKEPTKITTEVKPATKKQPAKKPVAKKTTAAKATSKKSVVSETKQSVITPTKQVMDMVKNDRIEVGDEMPVYFY